MRSKTLSALALACAIIVTPAVAATPAAASAAPSYRACYDGTCKFTFRRPVSFRVSARLFGFSRVYVSKQYVATFDQDMVVVRAGNSTAYLSEGGSGWIRANRKKRLSFRVLAITSKGATIRFG